MDDNSIIELYFARDEQAISETKNKYGKYCFKIAYNVLGNREDAEECENDTYLEAWNAIPPHEPRDYLYAFLARITRHLALNCCRDRARLKRSAEICTLSDELEQCLPAPDDTACRMDDMELGRVINAFLAGLDGEKRNVFIRRYWYLDSVADISRRFALSQSKVKTLLFRCRKQLRKYLEQEGYHL